MKLTVKKGTTSKILRIFVQDISKSDGSGLTGLVYNTASLTAYYIREGAASTTAITLVTATVGTYASSGFKEVDATNMPGVYELHVPNAVLAAGADSVVIFLKCAANMAPLPLEIQLDNSTAKDVYDRVGSPTGASIATDIAYNASLLEPININTNNMLERLTAARAGYLDNLSAGAVALAATALTNTTWTDAKAEFIDAAISSVPSDVWDEILTGTTHNIPTSAGRRLREIGAFAIHSGTAQAGNSHSITLAATASTNDGIYNRNLIVLTDNTGAGQTRTIVDYNATTKVVVVDRDWRVPPDDTTAYQITPDDTPLTVDHGAAQAGTARTITIREYASSVDDTYLCNIITIIAGTGRGQARLIGEYDGTTKIATICGDDWVTTPDTTSIYAMMPYGTTCTSCIAPSVLRDLIKTLGVLL